MESCPDILPPKREFVFARLKRRFDGYRNRHAEALPLHQQHSESLYSQEKEHTQQLQQRFLESKTKKSKKDKSSVAGSQPRGAQHSHGTSHQQHPQALQYLESGIRLGPSAGSPVLQQTQAHPIRHMQQDDRLPASNLEQTKSSTSSSVTDSRSEKGSFDELLKNNLPFTQIKQETPSRLPNNNRRDYNDRGVQFTIKPEVRTFMCTQASSTDFLPESFANFPDGSLNPDVLRDLIADVAGNAGDLMADFNFDEVKSTPSSLEVIASIDQEKPHEHHHLRQQQQQQQQHQKQQEAQQQQQQLTQRKTLQLTNCALPLIAPSDPSCQSSISPFRNSPQGPSSPQAQVRGTHNGRNADSSVQCKNQQQPPSSTSSTPSSSSVTSASTGPPYSNVVQSPLNAGGTNQQTHNSAIMPTASTRASPSPLVGVSQATTTSSHPTPSIQAHTISQSKLGNVAAMNVNSVLTGSNQNHFDHKASVTTIGYSQNRSQAGQQSTYINAQSQSGNVARTSRPVPCNNQFREVNHGRVMLQQQQQQHQMNRRELPMSQQRSHGFSLQAGHPQQHHELPKSQSGPAYQRRVALKDNIAHPPLHHHSQQQQQHVQHLRLQQQVQHRLHQTEARRDDSFADEARDPKTASSNISSNSSFAEALAFNSGMSPAESAAAIVHPVLHQQQQHLHQRQTQQCGQFRPMSGEQNNAYQSSGEPTARNPTTGMNQRMPQRPIYGQSPEGTQWRSYPEHCAPAIGNPMMNVQQIRNSGGGGSGVPNNSMVLNRQNTEAHIRERHSGQFGSGSIEQRTLGNSSSASSIDFNNLEFLAGVESTNELENFDAASNALNMLDDVLGHQNGTSTYKT